MPAPPPALYVENVLEDAIVTLTPDGAVSGKPVARLVDRDIGLECEDAGATGTRTYHFDRGASASTPTVHALLLAGAAMASETFTLETSPDNSAWTARGTAAPAADSPERFPLTAFACPRYVRLTVTDPAAPVRLTEVVLAPMWAFAWKPSFRALTESIRPNLNLTESASGRTWGVQRGARRWATRYLMSASPESDRVALLAALDTLLDGARPFWLHTVTGELRWVRLNPAITLQATDRILLNQELRTWDIPLDLVEELP